LAPRRSAIEVEQTSEVEQLGGRSSAERVLQQLEVADAIGLERDQLAVENRLGRERADLRDDLRRAPCSRCGFWS
jgi:hypothetical protein